MVGSDKIDVARRHLHELTTEGTLSVSAATAAWSLPQLACRTTAVAVLHQSEMSSPFTV